MKSLIFIIIVCFLNACFRPSTPVLKSEKGVETPPVVHIVKKRETFYDISKVHTSEKRHALAIAVYNHKKVDEPLKTGETILIPFYVLQAKKVVTKPKAKVQKKSSVLKVENSKEHRLENGTKPEAKKLPKETPKEEGGVKEDVVKSSPPEKTKKEVPQTVGDEKPVNQEALDEKRRQYLLELNQMLENR